MTDNLSPQTIFKNEFPEAKEYKEESKLSGYQAKQQFIQIFLITGVKLDGIITGNDEFTLQLSSKKFGEQIIYKHAIATISPKIEDYLYKNR